MIKKCICLLMALLIVLLCIPVTAGAQTEEPQSESTDIDSSPVKSIDIKPVILFEKIHGDVYTDSDTGKDYYVYTQFFNGEEYTVAMKDGTVITSTENYFEYNGNEYFIEVITDQSYENQWTIGNTYKATAQVMGFSAEFQVSIEPFPVKSLEVKPLMIYEGTNGDLSIDESGELYYHYMRYDEIIEYSLTFDDGTVLDCKGLWFDYKGETYYLEVEDNQSPQNRWEGGNTYEATATIGGVAVTFPVTILETVIESVEIEPITIIENTTGWWASSYGYEDYFYYYLDDVMNYTVTFKDGRVETGVGGDVLYHYPIYTYPEPTREKPWTAGNTYEVVAMVSGVYTTFPVTIIENPIKKLEIEPVSLIENTNGYFGSVPDEETGEYVEYFHYSFEFVNDLKYTITLNDGTVVKGTGRTVDFGGIVCDLEIDSEQSFENQWTAGNTYEAVASIAGVSTVFSVTIIPSAVKSIEIKPVGIPEGTNGGWVIEMDDLGEYTREYFGYAPSLTMEYTVTFADGAVVSGVGDIVEHNGKKYIIEVHDYQSYYSQWTAGNTYEAYAYILGAKTTFNVTIEEYPIKEVDFETYYISEEDDTDKIQFVHKDDETGEFSYLVTFCHTANPKCTITFTDGTVMQGDGKYLDYKDSSYKIFPYYDRDEWTPGNTYDSTVGILETEMPLEVFYDKARIVGIELVKQPDKTLFEKHERVNPEGAVIKIDYPDDTYEYVPFGRCTSLTSERNYEYIKELDHEFLVTVSGEGECIETTGQYMTSFAGHFEYINAEYKDREVTGVSIQEENTELYMTFSYDDGTEQKLKVLGMEINSQTFKNGTDVRSGLIVTDDGLFSGKFFRNDKTGEFYAVIDGVDGDTLTSNTLDSCKWWDLQIRYDYIVRAISVYAREVQSFDGNITAVNIDELLSIACNVSRLYHSIENVCSITSDGVEFRADLVKEAFFDLFGVTPDLELSNKYDAEKETVKVRAMGTAESGYNVPYDVEESNNTFTATISWGNFEYKMTLDENFNLIAYGIGENSNETIGILGDADGDGNVNIKDATHVQKAAAQIVELTDDEKLRADVNADNQNNVKDATEIQKFVAKIETGFPIGEPLAS